MKRAAVVRVVMLIVLDKSKIIKTSFLVISAEFFALLLFLLERQRNKSCHRQSAVWNPLHIFYVISAQHWSSRLVLRPGPTRCFWTRLRQHCYDTIITVLHSLWHPEWQRPFFRKFLFCFFFQIVKEKNDVAVDFRSTSEFKGDRSSKVLDWSRSPTLNVLVSSQSGDSLVLTSRSQSVPLMFSSLVDRFPWKYHLAQTGFHFVFLLFAPDDDSSPSC